MAYKKEFRENLKYIGAFVMLVSLIVLMFAFSTNNSENSMQQASSKGCSNAEYTITVD